MNVAFKNPKTGEVKEVKCGFSWILLLFSSIFWLPLFMRRLYIWGAIFAAIVIGNIIALSAARDQDAAVGANLLFGLISIGLSIYLAIKGNEMTAKNYLENGWAFVEPDSEITKIVKQRWGISV